MKDGYLEMRDLIGKEHSHLLWKDESGDNFLLLPWAEIFIYSNSVLGVHCFSPERRVTLQKKGLILHEMSTDDPFYTLYIKRENLGVLIALGIFKRRPHLKGRRIKIMAEKLGHAILPYRPELEPKEIKDE